MKTRPGFLWIGLCRNDTLGVALVRRAHFRWWWQCPVRYLYAVLAIAALLLLYVQAAAWFARYLDFIDTLQRAPWRV